MPLLAQKRRKSLQEYDCCSPDKFKWNHVECNGHLLGHKGTWRWHKRGNCHRHLHRRKQDPYFPIVYLSHCSWRAPEDRHDETLLNNAWKFKGEPHDFPLRNFLSAEREICCSFYTVLTKLSNRFASKLFVIYDRSVFHE